MTPLLPALLGCAPPLTVELLGDLHHQYGVVRSTAKGTAKVDVRLYEGETALQFVADVAPPFQVHVRTMSGPFRNPVFESAEWNDNPFSKTNAGFVSSVATLDWPILPGDPSLSAGVWHFELGVVDENQQYVKQAVAVDVLMKEDQDFSQGALDVSIVYTEGLEDDASVRSAVEDAEVLWAELYAQIGIEVRFQQYAYDVADLGPPAFGDEDRYVEIAEQTRVRSVNLVVSPSIEGLDQIFGIAGDIPGPLMPTPRSAVQVGTLLASGPDGRFSDEETRLLAETMAHETLHFLGLYHPVESTWAAWDVLTDTPDCTTEADCIVELGENLMFPFPVCSVQSCVPQSDITDVQGQVANRAVVVE